jgi:hypothetical protein
MEFKEIEQALATKTAELEAAKTRELKSVTERLALLNQKEEARQKEVRDAQRAATAAAVRRRLEQQEIEEQTLREATEKRVLEEQVYAHKQTALEVDVRTTEELERALTQQQHIEELVRTSLENAKYSVRKTIGTDGEVIVPNPLARFLQKEPD